MGQLNEISDYGTIGSHGYGHKHLTLLSLEEVERDIQKSISDIEQKLGMRTKYFSYPYGEYNSKVRTKAKKIGFRAIFNQDIGGISKESNPFDLNRIAITEDSVIKDKLKYEYLKAEWLNEEEMVRGNRLLKVHIKTDKDIKRAELYISGYGWRRVQLEDGVLDLDLNLKLKYFRNRIFLKTYQDKITSKIIVIEE